MKNPLYNRQHKKEYLLHGFLAALVYIIPTGYFLYNTQYANFYYLFIGNILFMFVIGFYVSKLINREYEGKRSVIMFTAGLWAIIVGIALSIIFCVIAMLIFFPDFFGWHRTSQLIQNAPAEYSNHYSTGVLLFLLFNIILCNVTAGCFASLMVAFAGKKNQTKDKVAPLNEHIPKKHAK